MHFQDVRLFLSLLPQSQNDPLPLLLAAWKAGWYRPVFMSVLPAAVELLSSRARRLEATFPALSAACCSSSACRHRQQDLQDPPQASWSLMCRGY